MPANSKSFDKVKRTDYDLLIQNLRSKGFATPYSDSGMLRANGFLANFDFQEKDETLNVNIRQYGKGETYASIFNMLESTIKSTNR